MTVLEDPKHISSYFYHLPPQSFSAPQMLLHSQTLGYRSSARKQNEASQVQQSQKDSILYTYASKSLTRAQIVPYANMPPFASLVDKLLHQRLLVAFAQGLLLALRHVLMASCKLFQELLAIRPKSVPLGTIPIEVPHVKHSTEHLSGDPKTFSRHQN